MSATSAIEWTDATWNPVSGCTRVSPGCDHCYAASVRERYNTARVPPQISLGVSIESNDFAWRADMLRECNADTLFFSFEPLLGAVDRVSLDRIALAIVGGESGPGWRPMEPAWVRDVRDRCIASNVPFFFKQRHKGATGRLLDGRTWDELPEGWKLQ